ncbi:hypothetical protein [Streptomyces sp. NPDC048442]|uniref:hypothetical protein n=1 Tax=Streptomyces sp. NPDC048442 TaxID=3154823 RepID=UPI0034296976
MYTHTMPDSAGSWVRSALVEAWATARMFPVPRSQACRLKSSVLSDIGAACEQPEEETCNREPTEQEWRDFQQHFEFPKVSLGTCGRPYGTPCKHEHACIRCPVPQIDPRQRGRLVEIIQNLRDRIREARGNGWLGEVEGLQVGLDAATAKLNSLKNTPADGRPQLVDLGMPVFTSNAPTPQLDTGEPELPG